VAAWDLNALPGDWKKDRRRWDQYHSVRVVILMLASLAIVASVMWRSGVERGGVAEVHDWSFSSGSPKQII
jgi:hypothetical protein